MLKVLDSIIIGDTLYWIHESSRVIEAKSKKGTTYWQGHIVQGPDKAYYTCTSSWSTTKTGLSKKVWSEPYYASPKNIGRANETTNQEQAEAEFKSMVQKEIDVREATKPLPMLAQTFRHKTKPKSSREKHIKYPAAVQPKFDGMRMLYNGTEGWSRGAKLVIPEVINHLHFNTKGYIIDGELILPDNPTVNVTSSATKRFQPGVSDKLVYRVYDIVIPDADYLTRSRILENIVAECGNRNIILAETHIVGSVEEVLKHHEDFVSRGFEGTIIRNLDGLYAIDERSNDLQKHKDFETAEYIIADIIPAGGGSSANVGKFICMDEKGDTFESTATGTEEFRRNLLKNKVDYIGKYAVVKFREMSGARQVPFHSNVLDIRETKEGGY